MANVNCGTCGVHVKLVDITSKNHPRGGQIRFSVCPACGAGMVRQRDGAYYPSAPAGGSVKNLPGDVEQAWKEARTSHAVAAYTAAEMMCRKILMHLAVEKGAAAPGETFVDYINALESEGHIASGLKPTVDRIRQRGNIANHDLPASTEDQSLTTILITEHLLRSAYEFTVPEGA